MTVKPAKRVRCAVYTRVSTEYGLDQEFNSLDAQHEAAEAPISSNVLRSGAARHGAGKRRFGIRRRCADCGRLAT